MQCINLALSDERFQSLFSDFGHTAYRLETLQHYDVSYEQQAFNRFLRGEARGRFPGIANWAERVRAGKRAGKSFRRVHVVEEPLSDYVRFESAWSYRHTVDAGEDVRIIPVRRGEWPESIPHMDYWLFDSSRLVLMNYAEDGAFVSAELVDEQERIDQAKRWREQAVFRSTPFAEYARGFDDLMNRK